MKAFKYLLLLLLVIIVACAVYFGAQDGKYSVTRSRDIPAPAPVVFEQIDNLSNWENWGPWMDLDPAMEIQYNEKPSGIGAAYQWKSDDPNVGNGRMTTTLVTPNQSVDQEIFFEVPIVGESKSDIRWDLEPLENNATRVSWTMSGENDLLSKVMIALSGEDMESSIGEMLEQGLENLEATTQQVMAAYSVNVDGYSNRPGQYYLYMSTSTTRAGFQNNLAQMYGALSQYVASNNLRTQGMPMAFYEKFDPANDAIIFSAALPTSERIETPLGTNILSGYAPEHRAVKVTLRGNYSHLNEAWDTAMQYVTENNLTQLETTDIPPYEIYVTDPGVRPNPADWVTELYIPVAAPVEPTTIN